MNGSARDADDQHSTASAAHSKQVIRYKQLLLKQRDIMRTLTQRLSERDESILALQEELGFEKKMGQQRRGKICVDSAASSLGVASAATFPIADLPLITNLHPDDAVDETPDPDNESQDGNADADVVALKDQRFKLRKNNEHLEDVCRKQEHELAGLRRDLRTAQAQR